MKNIAARKSTIQMIKPYVELFNNELEYLCTAYKEHRDDYKSFVVYYTHNGMPISVKPYERAEKKR